MAKKNVFYGAIKGFDEEKKTVECVILHFGVPNENGWTAKLGSLDGFLDRVKKASKFIAACYQHDSRVLIGKWKDFRIEGNKLIATLYLSNTPFVNDTVIPQLQDETLQGASPTIGASVANQNNGSYIEVEEGVIEEISLVGLPADLEANILKISAKIEANKENNFDIEILTL